MEHLKDYIREEVQSAVDNAFDEQARIRAQRLDSDTQTQFIRLFLKEFREKPHNYRFKDLVEKCLGENKDQIIEKLVEERIDDKIASYLLGHGDPRIGQKVINILLKNWDVIKNRTEIKEAFGDELEALRKENQVLLWKLKELGE